MPVEGGQKGDGAGLAQGAVLGDPDEPRGPRRPCPATGRHGVAGAIRPGHRPPRAVPPRPPDGAAAIARPGRLVLAVGGVDYDGAPKPLDDPAASTDLLALRRAETARPRGRLEEPAGHGPGGRGGGALAGSRRSVRLEGTEASTARLLRELPSARWAHIATHGFFADPTVRSILQPDPKLFAFEGRPAGGAGLRNPLVLSGLVLAGANRPTAAVPQADRAGDDLGIVTAEAIAGLPLQDLELVVLSACETGLGLVGGGEGVFGLQRAFHLAGADNVVASLWKVDDEATAALMAIFYDQLWRQNKPPIEALRAAQLTLYHHPELVGQAGPGAGARPTSTSWCTAVRPEAGPRRRCEDWAAFVLSGGGDEVHSRGGLRTCHRGIRNLTSTVNP